MADSFSPTLVTDQAPHFAVWRPLRVRDFRLLWVGQSVSVLGDQFYLIALPWLVLHLTGSGLALGTILLAGALPRLALLLVGGAVSDQVPPRTLMLASSLFRGLVCAILTAIVLLEATRLWHLFVLAAAFGASDAFFSPAIKVFVPSALEEDELTAGNALLQGSSMVNQFVGPSLAGLLIATTTTAAAFGVDTASFVFVTICLLLMRPRGLVAGENEDLPAGLREPGFLSSIREGILYTLHQPAIRALLVLVAATEFAFAGPFAIGLASLAHSRFSGSPAAFGAMLSTLGGGFLLGTIIAGASRRPSRHGTLIVVAAFVLGTGLVLLGFAPNVFWACVLLATIGTIGGWCQVLNTAWFQSRSDPRVRGRVQSLVLLGAFGLTPLSYALSGALTKIGLTFMFVVNGVFLLIATTFCASNRLQIDRAESATA